MTTYYVHYQEVEEGCILKNCTKEHNRKLVWEFLGYDVVEVKANNKLDVVINVQRKLPDAIYNIEQMFIIDTFSIYMQD